MEPKNIKKKNYFIYSPPPMSRNFANLPRPTLVFGRTFRGVFTSPSVEERNSLNELRTVIERLVVLRNQRQAQSGVSQVANQVIESV